MVSVGECGTGVSGVVKSLEYRLEAEAVVQLFYFIASPVIKANGVSWVPLEGEIKQQELNRKPFLCSRNGASLQLAVSPITALTRLLPATWQPPPLALRVRRCPCIQRHSLPPDTCMQSYLSASHGAICHQSPEFKPHGSNSAQTLPQVHDASSLARLAGSREKLGEWVCLCRRKGDCSSNWWQERPYQSVAFATLISTVTHWKVTG